MSRDLRDELAETLRERAASVPDVPTLAGAALARGRALRRRRRIATALAPAVAAVVVVGAVTALGGGGDRADRGPLPAKTPTAEVLPNPPAPFAYKLPEGPGPGTFYVRTEHADVRLPGKLSVTGIHRTAVGVVVETLGSDRRSIMLVGDDGEVRTLPGLQPPVAVGTDGRHLAARLDDGSGRRMTVVRLPDGSPVATLPGDRAPLAFANLPTEAVVFRTGDDRIGTWRLRDRQLREVPGLRVADLDVVSAPRGALVLLVVDGHELRAVDLAGRTLWTRPGDYTDGPRYAWSLRGDRLALAEGRHVDFVNARNGETLSRTPEQPVDVAGVAWLDATRAVVFERDQDGNHVRRLCDYGPATTCRPYRLRSALLPGW